VPDQQRPPRTGVIKGKRSGGAVELQQAIGPADFDIGLNLGDIVFPPLAPCGNGGVLESRGHALHFRLKDGIELIPGGHAGRWR
jgi:hypothetical protein